MNKIYTCICGRTFDKPNSFNGHKCHCKEHLITTYGEEKYLKRIELDEFARTRAPKKLHEYSTYKKEQQLNQWISEQHTCEKCGKVMTEKYGSGRFCSRACANTRSHSIETRTKISNSLSGKDVSQEEFEYLHKPQTIKDKVKCPICAQEYSSSGLKVHLTWCKRKYNIPLYAKINNIELDITQQNLDNYISTHPNCEICGKTIDESVKYKGPRACKRLCVDHNHDTGKFRGMLCQACNRQLGWYEKYHENISHYLNKDEV